MNFSRKRKTPIEVSLTPMIDVVFLLLIFFMVTTSFNQQSTIKINLPEASANQQSKAGKMVTLTIDAEGGYFISGDDGFPHQLINNEPDTLKRALIQAAGESLKVPFVISADGQTPHQAVVTAIDMAAEIGFSRVTFATKVINK